jgi:hypothetical protein
MENFMKFSRTILSTMLLASTATFANAYNGEVGLKYTDNGVTLLNNTSPIEDVSTIQLHGIYNFSEVNTDGKPLAESAFLGKNSFVRASHSEFDADGGGSADAQTIGVGFYIPNSIFYVGAEHYKFEDSDDTQIEVGVTPIDGLLISTSYFTESDGYEPNIEAKYVRPLAGDTAINLEAGFAQGEDGADDELYLAADYYFTNFFSVGGQIYDYGDGSVYSIRTRYFFNDSFSLVGEFASDNESDDESFSIGAAFRF